MKIYELLNEKVSSILYHAIDFAGAKSLLQQGNFRQKEISFTRSLTGEYHIANKMIGVIFEFDGDLLNRKYKGGPVGTENFVYDPDDEDDEEFHGRENKQLEDRLYTNDGIADVTKYIKNATLFCPKEFIEADVEDLFNIRYDESIKNIPAVVKLLSENKIPVRYAATVKEIYNNKVNNKEGFLDVIVTVDEDVARQMGMTITKNYEVFLSLLYLDGEELELMDTDKIVISANSEKEAIGKAEKEAERRTKEYHKKYGDSNSEAWYVDDVEEQETY